MKKPLVLQRIVSGGQTGADRGALRAALELGVLFGGWAPRGFRAEDGVIPDELRCLMQETPSEQYDVRTRKNVDLGDATLVLHLGHPGTGTSLTTRLVSKAKKPIWIENLAWTPAAGARGLARRAAAWNGGAFVDVDNKTAFMTLGDFLAIHGVRTLNVAGPRESHEPGLQTQAFGYVCALLRECDAHRAAFVRTHEGWKENMRKRGVEGERAIERFVRANRREIDQTRDFAYESDLR